MAALQVLLRILPLALLLILALNPATAQAAEFTVNVFTDGHDFAPGNGVCSINPPLEPVVCTLRAALEEVNALAAASGGDHRINVPAGIYTVNLGVVPTRPGQLDVDANVQIVGADRATTIVDGAGVAGPLMSTCGSGCTSTPKTASVSRLTLRNSGGIGFGHHPDAGPTTLTDVTVSDNASTGLVNRSNLTLNNVTITGNDATGTNAVAGLYNDGTLTATNLTVSNNTAIGSGGAGGIRHNDNSLTITGGTISGNSTAGGCAGGISAGWGQLTLTNVTVSGNSAENSGGGGGLGCAAGGLWLVGPMNVALTNTNIQNNQLTGAQVANYAAGMFAAIGAERTFTMTGGTVTGNSGGAIGGIHFGTFGTTIATGLTVTNNTGGMTGGGIYHASGPLTLTDSTIASNSTTNTGILGAGGLASNAQLSVERVTVSGNTGRGVALAPGFAVQAQLTNATISGNSGGGLAYRPDFGNGQNRLTNVTIAGNTGGPGVSTIAGSPPLRLKNTLVANHAGGNCNGTVVSEGSNLSSDTTCAASLNQTGDQNNVNPQLGPLANNGGTTQTHALQPGSPAIDGVVSGCPPPSTDQRGISRPQGARCDIGAYEAPPPPPPCAPRPNVTVATAPGGAGRLQVTVSANSNAGTLNNVIRQLRFGEARDSVNELVDVEGQTGRSGRFSVPITPPRAQVSFTIRQRTAGSATTVHFVAVDNCGDWQTLAGGGPNTFGGTVEPPPPSGTPTPTGGSGGTDGSTPSLGGGTSGGTTAAGGSGAGSTTAPAPACAPRPPVSVTTQPAGDGRLQITVGAQAAAHTTLQALRFGAATNARIEAGGQSGTGPLTVTLPAGTQQTTFLVARVNAGQAVTVPLTVVDSCGEWPTIVGGGASAF